ncbi:MAG TPA: 16S rRNA (guanine(966)-N(2))-methyltransferase RsmD [Pyrinomonadaceae bacterium]|nr:16S rRNA (guanine(966)-N(2))-methyltransferase RsmD [Pyrinomonadaceae bacterium]
MRVIAGKYRGRKLKSPPSIQTRPTSDRLRETLFNILAPRIEGTSFLDMCAGTGAVGVEALSRGAARVTFVDRSREMSALIAANVESLEVTEATEVATAEALEFLRRHIKHQAESFDIIFFDPPYAEDYEAVLGFIAGHAPKLLRADGIVIVEHHKKKLLSDEPPLKRYRELKQGDSVLSFFRVA